MEIVFIATTLCYHEKYKFIISISGYEIVRDLMTKLYYGNTTRFPDHLYGIHRLAVDSNQKETARRTLNASFDVSLNNWLNSQVSSYIWLQYAHVATL